MVRKSQTTEDQVRSLEPSNEDDQIITQAKES